MLSTRRTCRPAAEIGVVLLQTASVASVASTVRLRKIARWCQVIGIQTCDITDIFGEPFIFPGVVRTHDLPKRGLRMSFEPEQQVSNLWSCETLKAGIDHVMTCAKAEPVSDDEAEKELLRQLQDRPNMTCVCVCVFLKYVQWLHRFYICMYLFPLVTGYLHTRRLTCKSMLLLLLVLIRHGTQVEFKSMSSIKVSKN